VVVAEAEAVAVITKDGKRHFSAKKPSKEGFFVVGPVAISILFKHEIYSLPLFVPDTYSGSPHHPRRPAGPKGKNNGLDGHRG